MYTNWYWLLKPVANNQFWVHYPSRTKNLLGPIPPSGIFTWEMCIIYCGYFHFKGVCQILLERTLTRQGCFCIPDGVWLLNLECKQLWVYVIILSFQSYSLRVQGCLWIALCHCMHVHTKNGLFKHYWKFQLFNMLKMIIQNKKNTFLPAWLLCFDEKLIKYLLSHFKFVLLVYACL
jgi:hypothetical protein